MKTYVRVKVWGELACFTRPECKGERLSYKCMTPSSARGVCDCILWKPEMIWRIRKIIILNPIKSIALKRNEVKNVVCNAVSWMKDPSKFQPMECGAGSANATPRQTIALKDVAYIIEAEPEIKVPTVDDTPTKFMAMFDRRVEKGQCFRSPFFGCREFKAYFGPPTGHETPIPLTEDLGMMLYDVRYGEKEKEAVFFHAQLQNGTLDLSSLKIGKVN